MPHKFTRRHLLRAALGLTATGGSSCRSPRAHETTSSPSSIRAIDVHGHYGPYRGNNDLVDTMMSADAATVVERATTANTEWTLASPLAGLLPRGKADAVAANDDAARVIADTPGMLQWVIIDPKRPRTYEQAVDMLRAPFCVGVKVHPEEHEYSITEHGHAIFEFLAHHGALALIHSGGERSKPEDIVDFLDDVPEVTCILAHLGHTWDDDPSHQVRAIQRSKHGNVYVDTSSARSVFSGLVEWAVEEIGSERIVYGSDTPLYHAPTQRARIDHAEISTADKKNILRENMARVLRRKAGFEIAS